MKKLLLILISFFCLNAFAPAQSFQWSKNYGPEAWASTVEAFDDGVVIAGRYNGQVTIGSFTYTFPYTFSDIRQGFVGRYDATGNLQWAKNITSGNLTSLSAKTDVKRSVILTGTYQDSLVINNVKFFDAPGTAAIFVLKLDANGNVIWALNSGTWLWYNRYYYRWVNTEIDAQGNIYLNSAFQGSLSFGSFAVQTPTSTTPGVFVTKINASGNVEWLNNVNNNLPVFPQPESRLAVSNSGDAYVAIGNGDQNATVTQLYKYNASGQHQWTHPIPIGGDFDMKVPELGVDQSGSVYVAGKVSAPITLGATTLLPGSFVPHDPDYFLAKISAAGNWVWAKQISVPMGYYTSHFLKMNKKITNSIWLAPIIDGNFTIAGTTHQSPGGGSTRVVLTQADTSGNFVSSASILGTFQGLDPENYPHDINTDPFGNVYYYGQYVSNIHLGTTTLTAIPPVPGQNNSSSSFFLTKILDNANHVSGRLFVDANANGVKETSEKYYPYGMVEMNPGSLFISANDSGYYTVPVNPGNYVFNVAQPANHYLATPVTQTQQFNGIGQSVTGKDFALVPIPNRNEVNVTVTNVNPARPGFMLRYRLTLQNNGTTTLSDTVSLYYNASRLTFQNSPLTPAVNQPGKIKWYYTNLAPMERRNIDVVFRVNALTPLGSTLQAVADIKPYSDYVAWNNQDTLRHVVTGSFDPNDKQVNRTVIRPLEVANGKYLDYLIRFQNTGTDTAFTVVVHDSISTRLVIPSLEMLSASHPFTFKMLSNGKAEWRFENILLPDSNRNEPASHGFIRYRMLVKNTVPTGDSIKSRAAIYFDYNYPVYTNNALTRVEPIPVIDAAVMGITYPTTGCELSGQTSITVALKNFGNGPLKSIPLSYSLNGVALASEVFTGSIPAGGTTNFTFATKANMLPTGSYQLAVQSSLPTDTFTLNNSTQSTIHSAPMAPVVTASGPTTFCQGDSVTFTATNATPGVTYKWYVNGSPIFGGTNPTLVVNFPGSINVVAYAGSTCNSPFSSATTVTILPKPTAPVITQNGSTLTSTAASGNQWYQNGNLIPGATGQTYQATANGTYTVTSTQNACTSAVSNAITITNTGLAENTGTAAFTIYPNPARSYFTILLPQDKGATKAELYSLAGQPLKQEYLKRGATQAIMHVKDVPAGTYLVKLVTEKGTFVQRLVLY